MFLQKTISFGMNLGHAHLLHFSCVATHSGKGGTPSVTTNFWDSCIALRCSRSVTRRIDIETHPFPYSTTTLSALVGILVRVRFTLGECSTSEKRRIARERKLNPASSLLWFGSSVFVIVITKAMRFGHFSLHVIM